MALDTVTLVLSGEVHLAVFARAVSRFHNFVEALSEEAGRPDVEWILDDLSRASAVAVVRGVGDRAKIERVVRLYGAVGISLAENKPLRPYSRRVRSAAGRLRSVVKGKIESMRLETAEQESIIRPRVKRIEPQVAKPMAPFPLGEAARAGGISAYGAVQGRVQTLTNRGGLRFTLYDLLDDKAISCYLIEGHEDIMRDAWGRLATVEGLVSRDPITGRAIAVRQVSSIILHPELAEESYRQARAVSPPLTDLLPEHAIRRLRDA